MNVLVTGSSGFIGSIQISARTAEEFLLLGSRVRPDKLPAARFTVLHPEIETALHHAWVLDL